MDLTMGTDASALQTLLRALAKMSYEVAEQIEATSSGIAEELMKNGGCGKEVIVKLQAFDRMHQELDVISDVLRRCSVLMEIAGVRPHDVETILSQISLAQFRHRLQNALAVPAAVLAAPDLQLERVF
jgi:hypothetical protein